MTITVTTLTEAEFYERLATLIGQLEGNKDKPYLDTSTVGGIRHATIGIGFDLFRTCITKSLAVIFCTILCMSLCSANESIDQEKFKNWDSSLDQKKRCSVSNQVENNDCINYEYKVSDAELNRLYKLLINNLINPKPLKESQLAWIQFRDKTCAYEISGLSEGGSMPFYEKTACLINLTEKRILDLKIYSTWTYDGSPPRKH